ncbi:MAG TPA: helix-turn-helix domain-containing protein [Candidatus Binatia bacterium]|nr:helix-turn-helix domain-containing protein [Candidatus Binatia bacterium]
MQQPQSWLTASEIASIFRIKISTVRSWMRAGIPHLRCGRLVRFDAQKVQKWLEQKQTTNGGAGVADEQRN